MSSIPFLSLTKEEQMLIFKKMTNKDIINISSTCLFAKKFVEENEKILSSRPHYGQEMKLKAEEGGYITLNEGPHCFNFWEESYKNKIIGLSISRLDIVIMDIYQIPRLIKIVKNWGSRVGSISMPAGLPVRRILEIADNVWYPKGILLTGSIKLDKLAELKQKARNPGCFNVSLKEKYSHHLEFLKDFNGFGMDLAEEDIPSFFDDLRQMTDFGSLKCASVRVIPTIARPGDRSPLPFVLKDVNLPGTTLVYRGFPTRIMKMELPNGMCAMIHERTGVMYQRDQFINVYPISDTEDEVLDWLLEKIGHSRNTFTAEKRRDYFSKNTEDRLNEIDKILKNYSSLMNTFPFLKTKE